MGWFEADPQPPTYADELYYQRLFGQGVATQKTKIKQLTALGV